jgi:hypothetical protein
MVLYRATTTAAFTTSAHSRLSLPGDNRGLSGVTKFNPVMILQEFL